MFVCHKLTPIWCTFLWPVIKAKLFHPHSHPVLEQCTSQENPSWLLTANLAIALSQITPMCFLSLLVGHFPSPLSVPAPRSSFPFLFSPAFWDGVLQLTQICLYASTFHMGQCTVCCLLRGPGCGPVSYNLWPCVWLFPFDVMLLRFMVLNVFVSSLCCWMAYGCIDRAHFYPSPIW